MIVDMHNHTTLCKHAKGTVDEYVQEAIKQGTKYYGFTDHAPMNFDFESRMDFSQIDSYENMVLKAQEKYKNKIEILLGYEVDFLDGFIDDRVLERKVDYFIGSVHFVDSWGFDNPAFIGEYKNKDIDKIWEDYFLAIKELAKSRLFNIVGHLDLLKVFNYLPKKDMRILAKDAIKEIKKSGMVVELNSAGLRKPVKEIYPSATLLEMISNKGIDITFSSDAHNPEHVGFGTKEVEDLARQFGYNEVAIFKEKEKIMVKI